MATCPSGPIPSVIWLTIVSLDSFGVKRFPVDRPLEFPCESEQQCVIPFLLHCLPSSVINAFLSSHLQLPCCHVFYGCADARASPSRRASRLHRLRRRLCRRLCHPRMGRLRHLQ